MERWLYLCLLLGTAAADVDNEETDGQSSRKILGSSVVTSVSVVMETGNGKHTYFSDAVGHPLTKPHIASQVASPINLLNPDRYEFYTFNDDGELVKRLMTLQEIQGIIAGGDGEAFNYNSEHHAQMYHPENDVSGVVENVQNVLKEEMEAHKNPLEDRPTIIDTPDVSSTWNLILPAFFGGGDTVTIRETPEYVSDTTERLNISSRNPSEDENILPNMIEISSTIKDSSTESRTPESSTSSYSSSIMTQNTRPIPVVITTEKLKLDDLKTSSTTQEIISNLPEEENSKEVFVYDNKIDVSTETNNKHTMDIVSTSLTSTTNKINSYPTERTNSVSETSEYTKISELVPMITRPTIKTSEKTTIASVTFPPYTQFTHTEQISQTSVSPEPVSIKEKNTETPPSTSSDLINDNFVIVTLNDDKNNNETLTNDTLDATKYDVVSNVEQIIGNVTKTVLENTEKIPVENYATEEIQELLKSPDFNKTVTLASSLIASNKISSTTENVPLTSLSSTTNKLTTEEQEVLSKEESTPLLPSTSSTSVTQKISPLTTMQKIQMLTTTPIPYLNDNLKTNPPKITTNLTTLVPVSITSTQQTTTTGRPTTEIPTSSTPELQKISTTTQKILEPIIEPLIIGNRFAEPSTVFTTTTMSPSTAEITKLTTIITQPSTIKINLTTTQRTTTEKITTPLVVSPAFTQQPSTTPKPITTTTTTNIPTTISAVTFITNSTSSTTPSTTSEPTLQTSTTAKTVQPLTITTTTLETTHESATTPRASTTPRAATTIETVNISEPYRKTEEFISANKIPTHGDTWKLVDTVKPSESNKISSTSTTSKPLLEPYLPPVKVDLSSQGNFGMPGVNEDMVMFSKMYNELALKFWSVLSLKDINSERSAVVSPFGTISMLAMIFLGARGGTSGEMNDLLKLDDFSTFNPHLVFKEVTEAIVARKSTSAIVRELYTDNYRGKVLEFYKERARQFYDGHVEEVDFKKIHNFIRRRTNALISKQTRGQLPQYLEETTMTLRAPLSALSTNIFQADCSQSSTEGRDGELYFIVLPSIRQRRLVPIPAAVWRTGFIAGYDPELDATAVSLGTMNQAVSTVFVMPGQQGHSAPGDVLLRLEARLLNTTYMPEMWTQLLKSMLPRPGLEIQLPRFLQKSVINATEALKRMGLSEMFNKNKADFRGINGIGHDLYFSDLMQVNEFSICGETQQMHAEIYPSMTEYLENPNEQMRNFKYVDYLEENEYDKYSSIPLPLRPRQARLPEIPRLRFDRPFLYFVRHNPTGLILHMGRFNPRLLT